MSFFAPRLYVAVAVKFHENWLLATYFVKWLHRLHRQQAIARQSEQAMTLAASVQCRRAFNHWKHCILLHALSIYLIINVVFIASIMCYAQICSICIPRALLKCILSRWWWLFGVKEGILSELFYIGNALPLQWAQLTKTVHTARLGHEFVFMFFGLHDLSLCSCMFCFTLVSWVIFLHVLALA